MLKNDGSKMEKKEIIKMAFWGIVMFLLFILLLIFSIVSIVRLNIELNPIGISGCIFGVLVPVFIIAKSRGISIGTFKKHKN
ncbi:putative membrane protein [Clostridioides difficile CD160]|nr:putative membrane protein [Clostridioides difficile CD160]